MKAQIKQEKQKINNHIISFLINEMTNIKYSKQKSFLKYYK